MKTVVIEVAPLEVMHASVLETMRTRIPEKEARISFPTYELLSKVLSGNRLELLQAMAGKGRMSMREAAALVGRDIKAVHTDIAALLNVGFLERTDAGVEFPYEHLRVEIPMQSAA